MFAGIDEAGKGCVLGSLFLAIAGVKSLNTLKGMGLNDSKQIPKPKRKELYKKLISVLDFYEIIEIKPSEIDSNNLLTLEAKYTRQLISKHLPTKIYVDCPHPRPQKYLDLIKVENVKIVTEHKADSKYLPCMAASILAKVKRDSELIKLGVSCSGYPGDIHTNKFLEGLYPDFPDYVRKSWKTTKNLIAKKEKDQEYDLL